MTGAHEVAALTGAIAAALAGLLYIARKVRRLVHFLDRIEAATSESGRIIDRELTRNSGSSMKDQVEKNSRNLATLSGLVSAVVIEVAEHGRRDRAAMAIYRKALADQGIHLPVAPGEDGYGVTHEETE